MVVPSGSAVEPTIKGNHGLHPPGEETRRLVHDDLVATAITRDDLADDVRGINASLALIKRTRGGQWPTGPVDEDYNYVDLVWHELEFREATSFTYVVRNSAGAYSTLAQLAWQAGQERKGDLAKDKAIELTPKDQRETVKGELEAAKQQVTGGATAGGGSG